MSLKNDKLMELRENEISQYTIREKKAIDKALKILEKSGLYVETNSGNMPESDGLERWCIHPEDEK